MRIGFQSQQQLGFKRRQLADSLGPLIPGFGSAGLLQPFLDGVARQTRPPLNVTDSQMFTIKHPSNLCIYDHGNHPCLLLLGNQAGYVDYLVIIQPVQMALSGRF